MSDEKNHREKEERALNALIAAAFDQDPCDEDLADLQKYAASLSDEDRAALSRADANLIDSLFKGEPARASPQRQRRQKVGLVGAMNRADEDTELTDAARKEMEQKLREADQADESDEAKP